MTARTTISLSLRFRVLERDHFACRYCGSRPPLVRLELDHIVPVSAGGETVEANLVTACGDCNGGKGAELPAPPPLVGKLALETTVLEVYQQSDEYADYWGPLTLSAAKAIYPDAMGDIDDVLATVKHG